MNTFILSVLFSCHLRYISFNAFKLKTTFAHPLSPFTFFPPRGESLAAGLADLSDQNLSFQTKYSKKRLEIILLKFPTVLVHLLDFLYIVLWLR